MLFSIYLIILRVPRTLGEHVFIVSSKNQCKYSMISIMYRKEKMGRRGKHFPPHFYKCSLFLSLLSWFSSLSFLTFICAHVSLTHVFTDLFTYFYYFILCNLLLSISSCQTVTFPFIPIKIWGKCFFFFFLHFLFSQ